MTWKTILIKPRICIGGPNHGLIGTFDYQHNFRVAAVHNPKTFMSSAESIKTDTFLYVRDDVNVNTHEHITYRFEVFRLESLNKDKFLDLFRSFMISGGWSKLTGQLEYPIKTEIALFHNNFYRACNNVLNILKEVQDAN